MAQDFSLSAYALASSMLRGVAGVTMNDKVVLATTLTRVCETTRKLIEDRAKPGTLPLSDPKQRRP